MDFRTITRRQLYAALVILALIIGAVVLERVVVTDRERIEATIDAMRDAAGRADVEALLSGVSEDYYDEMLGREGLRALAENYFERYGRTGVRILSRAVSLRGDEGAVEMRVFARAERGANGGEFGRSTWLILLQKESDGVWRIIRVEPISWEGREVQSWSALRRWGGF